MWDLCGVKGHNGRGSEYRICEGWRYFSVVQRSSPVFLFFDFLPLIRVQANEITVGVNTDLVSQWIYIFSSVAGNWLKKTGVIRTMPGVG